MFVTLSEHIAHISKGNLSWFIIFNNTFLGQKFFYRNHSSIHSIVVGVNLDKTDAQVLPLYRSAVMLNQSQFIVPEF